MTTAQESMASKTLQIYHIKKYESAIFTKPNLVIKSVRSSHINNIEITTIDLTDFTITSVCIAPPRQNEFVISENLNRDTIDIVMGDFNSRSAYAMRYTETIEDGQKLDKSKD